MSYQDPSPDPLDRWQELEGDVPHLDPLPGHGLGMGRLGEHGLGYDRLKHSGLGEHRASPERGPEGHNEPHSAGSNPNRDVIPGVHHRGDDSWRSMDQSAAGRSPAVGGANSDGPTKLPPPLYSGSNDPPVKLTWKHWLAVLSALAVMGVLIMFALRLGPGGGGQFEELGQKLGQGNARQYKYVSDYKKQLYWPNEMHYVDAIPKENRLYIQDDKDLAAYSNYKPGKL